MATILAEAGEDLFKYNREGWRFGAELRQRDLYQRQKMRIKQVDLYRDDIRNLFDLTVGKMDKYVIVCLVMLAITMELYYKGRNPVGTPSWLFWCWAISVSGAMLYLFMSIWFALHASISAQTFSVRCLTQWLRLPIPSPSEVAQGATKLEQYEQSGNILRVPVLEKAKNDLINGGLFNADPKIEVAQSHRHDLTNEWQLFTSHFTLFNILHRMWQAHESYARVCMCLGMNHFLFAMSYFSLADYSIEWQTPWAGWAYTAIFQSCAYVHAKLNLNLTNKETLLMVFLVISPAFFLSVAVAVVMAEDTTTVSGSVSSTEYDIGPCVLACMGILCHIGWICFYLYQTKSDLNGLPLKFSTVWCIDVLGFGMETLREVQEPVGKQTYSAMLPGYHKGGPLNVYNDAMTPVADETLQIPHTKESVERNKLPWKMFKLGSVFVILLWVVALLHTILISSGVLAQISTINPTAHR